VTVTVHTAKDLTDCACLAPAGLDSFAALSVMGYLQDIAASNKQTVIATIHQPRNAIWETFDTVRGGSCSSRCTHQDSVCCGRHWLAVDLSTENNHTR
jgi:hypothetical protein